MLRLDSHTGGITCWRCGKGGDAVAMHMFVSTEQISMAAAITLVTNGRDEPHNWSGRALATPSGRALSQHQFDSDIQILSGAVLKPLELVICISSGAVWKPLPLIVAFSQHLQKNAQDFAHKFSKATQDFQKKHNAFCKLHQIFHTIFTQT